MKATPNKSDMENSGSGQQPPPFLLVREDMLPDALIKTMQAKELLARGEAKTVHEAVERVGLSRSAFYRYRDGIYPLSRLERERLMTVSLELEHRSGILSRVLALLAAHEGNVLTIHQSIPLQGMGNVVITLDTTAMEDRTSGMLEALRQLEGVRRAIVVGQGWS